MGPLTVAERLGLHRPQLRAWALYDWANSVFMTTVLLIFPVYFVTVAGSDLPRAVASRYVAWSTALSVALVALSSPVLGAAADHSGRRKLLLLALMGVGAAATAGLSTVGRGDWPRGAALFVLGNFGASGSIVFSNSLLPAIAHGEELDRVSTAGFALGYLGGGILLAANLLWIQNPALVGQADASGAIRVSFLSAAAWWVLFSLPVLLRVPEPPRRGHDGRGTLAVVRSRLAETLKGLRGHPDALLLVLAFFVYNDGINTILRMATLFGTEMGLSRGALFGAPLMVQFIGVPCAFGFGALAHRAGPKQALYLALSVYVVISAVAGLMTTATHFFAVAFLVGTVMGGAQALGRSLFARMVPRHKTAEMFGFFGVFDKMGGVMGSALFALALQLTGSSRPALLALVAFFVTGGLLLARVDVDRGERAARTAEAREAG
jgi:UMF1 family MFS transporter